MARKLVDLSNQASVMQITSANGTDLTIKIDPARSSPSGHVTRAGFRFMSAFTGEASTQVPPGQASFGVEPGGIDGTMVFDGTIYPPPEIGVLKELVTLEISEGRITKITGGREARLFERWLAGWNHPGMYEIAHCTYGFNPGVTRVKGDVAHDERVFGCVEFGIGPKFADAPAHTDGVILEPTIWADDVQLEDEGRYVHPELIKLARELGAPGY
jgi:leucyl aminopeptidase (aminopeptidase T)